MKSLKAQHHLLTDIHEQIEILEHGINHDDTFKLVPFQQKLESSDLFPLTPTALEIFRSMLEKCATRVANIAMWMQGLTGKK